MEALIKHLYVTVKHLETVDKEKANDLLTNLKNAHFLRFFVGSRIATSRHYQRNNMIIADCECQPENRRGHHADPITQNNKWKEGGRFYGII